MASKHKITVGEELRYDSDVQGLRNLSGTFARPGSRTLPRWRRKLAADPTNAKILGVGDSTSDFTTSAAYLWMRLRVQHTQPGEALYGMTSGVFTDGATTSGSAVVTSATAAFTSADVGRFIGGAGIPVGATILSVESATSITLSANATATATGVTIQIGRNITARGYNGLSLASWLADSTKLAAVVADAPDLIIASWGLNDVRVGATDQATMVTRLRAFVEAVQAGLPNTDIVLRIPNPMLTTNVSSLNYVQDAQANINPAGAAQSYSTLLRQAYLALEGSYANVLIADVQANVFGTTSRATHPLMTDQLHPTPSSSVQNGNPGPSGYTAIADYLASVIGKERNAFKVDPRTFRASREFVISTGGSAFLDLAAYASGEPAAAQFPITTADTLFVEGMAGPIALTSGSISRPFGGTSVRITGLTGNDFTGYVGRTAVVALTHADATTGDRQIVSVDLPSIAAGATVTQTVAVTGARTGALHDATAVLCTPPATFISGGLYLTGCYPSANDTVTLVITNPTGGAVDIAASNFAFWVVR